MHFKTPSWFFVSVKFKWCFKGCLYNIFYYKYKDLKILMYLPLKIPSH